MKRIGLVGGVTWHSTRTYYERLNQGIATRLGPFRSADLALRSIDYGIVRTARTTGDHRPLARAVVNAARDLRRSGAEGILLCSNSVHAVEPQVRSQVPLPIVHIADTLGNAALQQGHRHLAFFGTGFTMRQPFLRDRLEAMGLTLSLPADLDAIDRIILDDLARGIATDQARQTFLDQLRPLIVSGATAFVAGCTEIPLLIGPADLDVPLLDTLELHVEGALDWMLDA